MGDEKDDRESDNVSPTVWQHRQTNRPFPKTEKVRLCSSNLVLPAFAETPEQQIAKILCSMIIYVNTRGNGCCPFHITISRLRTIIKNLMAGPCHQEFSPHQGWQ